MSNKTFIVKLAGDSKSYQNSMSGATKALDKYQKQNLSTGAAVKTLSSTLTKYISVAALVKGAQEAINRTIRGSQTTADAWAATMHSCKVVADNFFSSLSTGDFTSFNMGLNQMVANAKAAAKALDALGNASMSWSYFQTARMADITELSAVVGDTNAPLSERKAAAQQVIGIRSELQGYASGYEERAMEAMARKMTEATMVEWSRVTREDLERILQLDLLPSTFSQERKAELAAQYKEYQSRMEALKADFEQNYRKRERVQTGVSQTGLPLYSVVDRTKPEDYARYNQQMRDLATEYQDVILYNETLVRKSDQWLQELIQIVQMADNAERSMRRVNSAAQTAQKVLNIQEETAPVQQPLTLPAMAGITVPEVSGPTLPDKLPEVAVQLDSVANSADGVANSFERMSAAAEGVNSIGRAAEHLGAAFESMGGSGMGAAGNIISAAGAAVQAYTQMAQAASMAAAAEAATETPTVWGKIAAITAMVGAFASMVSEVKSSVHTYAEGGIVPGNNFHDGITARVSSGEMYINEADQRRLYDMIHTGNYGGGNGGRSVVTGEQIVLAVNNYGRRTNRGELVFAGKG